MLSGKEAEEEVKTAPKSGNYVHGLFIEGADWDIDRHCLTESQDKILFNKMPHIWLKPVQHNPDGPASLDSLRMKVSSRD